MLPTIEKMLLLKSVNLFRYVPDPILFEIASIVKDETVPEGQTIIHKDDLGDFMYIIAAGRVRIHDGDGLRAYVAIAIDKVERPFVLLIVDKVHVDIE